MHGGKIENFSDADLGEIFADVPGQELSRDKLTGQGLGLIDALVTAGLAKSNGEARRLIGQGGAYVNNHPISDVATQLTTSHLASETVMVLRSGKKKYALLKFPR